MKQKQNESLPRVFALCTSQGPSHSSSHLHWIRLHCRNLKTRYLAQILKELFFVMEFFMDHTQVLKTLFGKVPCTLMRQRMLPSLQLRMEIEGYIILLKMMARYPS